MSDRGTGEERRKRLLQVASAAVFLAVVVIAVLIVIAAQDSGSGGDTKLEGARAVTGQLDGIPQRGLVLGEPAAKVTLVEFGDLQCPVCKGFSEEVIPSVIDAKVRSGEARLEFRSFTIIGQESNVAAAAAIAAGRQGRGWDYVELFYRNQGAEASGYVTDAFMTEIARGAGVPNIARWNRDRRSSAVLEEVENQTTEAKELGFSGTPSFAVEGPASHGLETLGFPESGAGELEEAIEAAQSPPGRSD
ncbi:MAG TPA: thioredoxin domain-containing protein [Solirubrobacterales bacterium]|jgi:protein-disulfide isomerase|nr:thioredoxin domain-containing protein [Solirubrobacterales bacterium]